MQYVENKTEVNLATSHLQEGLLLSTAVLKYTGML